MGIERDPQIEFHELGTLISITRWVTTHDEGLAEWLKNTRRAYQTDRADVQESHRAALLLLHDQVGDAPARIGLLDVGGATLEDVTRWSKWQDPEASSRGSDMPEEQTQGNGAKAYMFKLFRGPATILGVKDRRKNCKGFDGATGTVERGTPGFMPDKASGEVLELPAWEPVLTNALEPYGLTFDEMPPVLRHAIRERHAFTLVEGIDPVDVYKGRVPAEDLIHRLLRHDQSTLAVEQLRLYAAHNGKLLNGGNPLQLEPIAPHPGFEQPIVHEIPERLPDDSGRLQSTTMAGQRPKGRLILHTSTKNMPSAYKELKPRWKVVPGVDLEWHSTDRHVLGFMDEDLAEGRGKGACDIWVRVAGTSVESVRVAVDIWQTDHVLLTPRALEVPVGRRRQITAEVTNDEGERALNVYLNWEHDAPDPLTVRIHPSGWVAGNRIGRTSISAGAGDPANGGVWARIRADVTVIENQEEVRRGGGFPRLLLTGRDIDPRDRRGPSRRHRAAHPLAGSLGPDSQGVVAES